MLRAVGIITRLVSYVPSFRLPCPSKEAEPARPMLRFVVDGKKKDRSSFGQVGPPLGRVHAFSFLNIRNPPSFDLLSA